MLYFQFPRTYLFTYKNIDYIESYQGRYPTEGFENENPFGFSPLFSLKKGDRPRRNESSFECVTFPSQYISNSVSYYLQNIKERINEHERDWEIYKKYTNPYEYIHTNVPNNKKSVAKHKPLSRSYFKMIEIVQFFDLLPKDTPKPAQHNHEYSRPYNTSISSLSMSPPSIPFSLFGFNYQEPEIQSITNATSNDIYNTVTTPIRSFHLAEGPGGFIEAFMEMRNNPFDTYIGMTILDDKNDMNIPSWKKSGAFMKEHCNNFFIENGVDKTGDILHFANFTYCVKKYGSSMDFITADGGFDFSTDFNLQENNIIRLIFAQIAYAVCMQKKSGHFVLKIFDAFYLHTIDLLYLLSSLYETVCICKPHTSRYANSEKYIVCKNFLFSSNEDIYPYFRVCFQKMTESLQLANSHCKIGRFLNIPLSSLFITRLEEYNSIFAQQQIETIYNTISLIETKNNKYRDDQGDEMAASEGITWGAHSSKYSPRKINILNRKIGETSIYSKNSNHIYFNDETTFVKEKIQMFIKNNVKKSTQWCKQYKIPYNVLYNDIS